MYHNTDQAKRFLRKHKLQLIKVSTFFGAVSVTKKEARRLLSGSSGERVDQRAIIETAEMAPGTGLYVMTIVEK